MTANRKPMRVGFELEVMFLANEFPALKEAAKKRGFEAGDYSESTPYYLRRVIADSLESYIGDKVYSRSKSGLGPDSRWTVKEESELEPEAIDGMLCAVEIVTPPLEIPDAKKALTKLFKFCLHNGGVTDHKCGFHMTFDLHATEPYCLANIVLNLDEEKILKLFKREGHSLAVPQREHLMVEAATALADGNEFGLTDEFLEHSLGKGKHFAINTEKVMHYNIVEFRHCGGPEILFQKSELFALIDKISGVIQRSEIFQGDNLLGPLIENDVNETLEYLDEIHFISSPKRVGIKNYDVVFRDRSIGSICQLDAARFAFHFNNKFLDSSYSGLHVDSLSKAKVLVALTIHKKFDAKNEVIN